MNHDIGTTRSGLRLGYTTGSCAAGAAESGGADASEPGGDQSDTTDDAEGNRTVS